MKMERNKKQKSFRLISFLTLFLGILLIIYMIKVEDELGALPLLLIILGSLGLLLNKKIN